MTRVVQIEPGPIPTLTTSTPASNSASAPSAVATLPAMIVTSGWALVISAILRNTPALWPWAVSTTKASTSASIKADALSKVSRLTPIAAATNKRP